MEILHKTVVLGEEEREATEVRRTGRFLCFKTEWWETVSTRHIGNDIHIRTAHPIRAIYLNGEEIRAPKEKETSPSEEQS